MNAENLTLRSEVKALYEAYPYPPVGYLSPFLERVRSGDRPTLNYRAAYAAAFGSTAGAAERPRILVAGCGTFEAVVVALANPWAEIVAVDLSAPALERMQWQARWRGLRGRITHWAGDFCELPERFGRFDFVLATGVLHHCGDPASALRALAALAGPSGVFRFMVYSAWGRALLYGAKKLAALVGAADPGQFLALIGRLPPDHPYRIYFHLYRDSKTKTGISDGFLHPCDHPFMALALRDLLHAGGLEVTAFLHGPEGQPGCADSLAAFPSAAGAWERVALLEALAELEGNFLFFAARRERAPPSGGAGWEWNEALPKKGKVFTTLLGRELPVDRAADPESLAPGERAALARAFFLLRKGQA